MQPPRFVCPRRHRRRRWQRQANTCSAPFYKYTKATRQTETKANLFIASIANAHALSKDFPTHSSLIFYYQFNSEQIFLPKDLDPLEISIPIYPAIWHFIIYSSWGHSKLPLDVPNVSAEFSFRGFKFFHFLKSRVNFNISLMQVHR